MHASGCVDFCRDASKSNLLLYYLRSRSNKRSNYFRPSLCERTTQEGSTAIASDGYQEPVLWWPKVTIHLLLVTFNSLVASDAEQVRSKVVLPSCVVRSHSEGRKKGAKSKKQRQAQPCALHQLLVFFCVKQGPASCFLQMQLVRLCCFLLLATREFTNCFARKTQYHILQLVSLITWA